MTDRAVAGSLFPDGGEAGALVRTVDWTQTSLGAPRDWPIALLAQVRAMLATRQPICIFWGPELVNLYNDGFLPILGEKHPAAMGQRAEDCWREAWPLVGPQLLRAQQGECIFNEEVLVPIARGGRVGDAWFNYSYSPLYDDAGQAAGVLVICTEVTLQVTARKQIEALVVQQSVARRQSDALREQAEAASRAKDEFLATVSHELRTPLTAILGWSRILKQPGGLDRAHKGIEVIDRNARAQAKIIDDILDVSRIISGKLLLSPNLVDVASVMGSAIDSVRPTAAANGVRLQVEVEVTAPWMADEDRLRQIVWNLLSNAVKFTPSGGSVTMRVTDRDGALRIVVRDTGRGIAPSFLPFVFDRFRQGDASTTRQHGGLGLGLAIVRTLVDMHGGVVTAHSDGEGCGATFEVVLPRRENLAPVAAEPAIDPAGPPDAARPSLRGVTILLLDDEHDTRELTALVLEDAGATVLQAPDVASALRTLREHDVSAIVSDIGMPGVDGYSFLERVRADPRTQTIPAVALTAFARAEDRQRAFAAGFQRHIAKPIDPANLVATVSALIRS